MFRSSMKRVNFTVPAGAGSYAPEVLELKQGDTGPGAPVTLWDHVDELREMVEALPATAQIEVDLLIAGKSGAQVADWLLNVTAPLTATGLGPIVQLAGWYGVRVRAKSGGTGGTATVSVSWKY